MMGYYICIRGHGRMIGCESNMCVVPCWSKTCMLGRYIDM